MEQKDFILREIEKIGLILNAIKQKMWGEEKNLSISIEKQSKELTGQLLDDINFDLNLFMSLKAEESNEYISRFEGFNARNIELLAECIANIGINSKSSHSEDYFKKALQLYELLKSKDKTYSIERETNITIIKNKLKQKAT